MFERGFGFERYVDYMLDVPMYFVYRDGSYIDCAGQSFRDFMAGRLPALPGATPTMSDWSDHLTTAFPEVRMKRILEMRGADAGPWAQICALPALWSGLLYDQQSLDGAAALVADWSQAERDALSHEVPRTGLKTPFRGRTVREVALAMLELARAGSGGASGSTAPARTRAISSRPSSRPPIPAARSPIICSSASIPPGTRASTRSTAKRLTEQIFPVEPSRGRAVRW